MKQQIIHWAIALSAAARALPTQPTQEPMGSMDVLASGGWTAAGAAAGYGLMRALAARRRGEGESKARPPAEGTRSAGVDLRHEFELLQATLNRIEVAMQPLPAIQRAVDTAGYDVRVLQGHIRRIDADVEDARRELAELESRVKRVERRD